MGAECCQERPKIREYRIQSSKDAEKVSTPRGVEGYREKRNSLRGESPNFKDIQEDQMLRVEESPEKRINGRVKSATKNNVIEEE